MGWRHARRESPWMRSVTLLLSQIGVAAVSAAGVPRSLLGRRDEPSIVLRIEKGFAGCYKAIDGWMGGVRLRT